MSAQSILIIGAGPVGLTAALELKRRGLHPRIIDAAPAAETQSRALAVNPRTLAILKPAGLTERVIEAGNPVQSVYLRSVNKLLLHVDLSILPKPYDFMLMLPQNRIEELLATHLGEMGITVERATKLVALRQDEDGVTATLQHPDGTETTTQSSIVIGTDGAHSAVRHAISEPFDGSAYDAEWSLADAHIETDLPLDGVTLIDAAPDIFAMFPISGNRVRLLSDRESILENLPAVIRVKDVIWESTFRISHRLVKSYQNGHVFLAGDAAHIHSPLGGRGMNLGMEDAAWLAWLIAEGRTDEYTNARRPVAKQLIETVDPATRFVVSSGPLHKFARRHIAPVIGSFKFVQKRILPIVSASATPYPPWL